MRVLDRKDRLGVPEPSLVCVLAYAHAKLTQVMQARLRAEGESFLTWQYLRQLASGGPCEQRALGEAMCHSRSRVSRQLTVLVEAQLVVRTVAPDDHRRCHIHLTERGCRWLARWSLLAGRFEREVAGSLSREEQQTCQSLLLRLADARDARRGR